MTALAKPLDSATRELLADIEERRIRVGGKRGGSADINRIRVVESMWIDMYPTATIIEEVVRAFACSPITVNNDLYKVRRHHKLSEEIDRASRVEQMRAQWIDLRRDARANGDRRTAALVNDRLCKMDGLYAPERTENVNVSITLNVTIDQVLDRITDPHVLVALSTVLEAMERAKPIDAISVDKPLTLAADSVTSEE